MRKQRNDHRNNGKHTSGSFGASRRWIAAFLAALTVFGLAGCADGGAQLPAQEAQEIDANESIVQEEGTASGDSDPAKEADEFENSPYYYMDYYKKITDEEVQEIVKRMGILFPDSIIQFGNTGSIYIKDIDGVKKPIQVVFIFDKNLGVVDYYAVNGVKLFEVPIHIHDFEINPETAIITNFPIDKISKKCPYLEGIEILKVGVQGSHILFLNNFKYELKNQNSINYIIDGWVPFEEAYGTNLQYDLITTISELAQNYAKYVPPKHQFDINVLLKDYESTPERKYVDCWAVSDEELETRMESVGITFPEDEFPMSKVQTLVFEDKDGKRFPRYVLLSHQGNELEITDFASRLELFTFTGVYDYWLNHDTLVFEGINYDSIKDAVPFFEDKKIIKISAYFGITDFYVENMDYFRERDNINYEEVSSFAELASCPMGSYNTNDMVLPTSYYMRRYCSIPEEDIITREQLTVGLDIDFDKVFSAQAG